MKPKLVGKAVGAVGALLVAVCLSQTRSTQANPTSVATPEANAKPLLLEKNEGELRTRRIRTDSSLSMPSTQFMLKVSPNNNGSQHLVLGTEEVIPGASIPRHRHFGQDEILLIQTGKAHVWLGDQERDVHAGGLVFIPANTWAGLKNTGAEPISLVFIFSAPGWEDWARCASVPASEKPTSITKEELKQCTHQGHLEMEGL